MLRPADLGPTWRYGTSPGVTRHSPATKPTNGSTLVVGTILGNSRWNGTAWAVTQTVTETATEFRSATDARNAIRLIVSSTDICHCVPKPAHVGGLLVWNRPAPTSLQAQFYVLSGRTEYYVSVAASSGTAQDAKQIYQTAIRRIQAAG